MNAENFKNVLQQEFLKRGSKNPSYSLRSYARFLGIHHSTLSGLLSGKRPITKKTVSSLSLKLGLFPDNFIKDRGFKLPDHQLLEEDVFNRISEWYFDAILELAKVKSFDFKTENISRYLGISEPQASIAVDVLLTCANFILQTGMVYTRLHQYLHWNRGNL